jgi:hypothetical protein
LQPKDSPFAIDRQSTLDEGLIPISERNTIVTNEKINGPMPALPLGNNHANGARTVASGCPWSVGEKAHCFPAVAAGYDLQTAVERELVLRLASLPTRWFEPGGWSLQSDLTHRESHISEYENNSSGERAQVPPNPSPTLILPVVS